MLKGELNPVMRFIVTEKTVMGDNTSTVKIIVDGLAEGSEWTVLSREEKQNAEISSQKVEADRFKEEDCRSGLSLEKKTETCSDAHSPEPRLSKFQRHLESFTQDKYILAKDDDDGIIIICMNLRFSEDIRRPIVFREIQRETDRKMATVFEILNIPNTEICANQSLGGSSSLPGGLVIISDSKKALILANSKEEKDSKTITLVEKVPILKDEPAPQAREHKLLLAYYLILRFEFNPARKLLSPSISIHHNEAFSIKEIEILRWITEIELEAPEALALKLFAYLHYEINRMKFPLEYSKYDLKDISAPKTGDYIFSLREMSEKYYVFLEFSEVLEESLFSELFLNDLLMPPKQLAENDKEWGKFDINNDYISREYNIGDRIDSSFFSLLLSKNFESLNLASKLLLRRNHKTSNEKQTEMATFCYVKDPGLWTDFTEKLFGLSNKNLTKKQLEDGKKEAEYIYRNVMETCINQYNHLFKGVNQSFDISSTSLKTLKATFEAEANRLKFNIDGENFRFQTSTDLVSPLDIKTFTDAEKALHYVLKSGDEINFANFDADTLERSDILAKLQNSIIDFVLENGQTNQIEINLISNVSTLSSLLTFLSSRISDLSIIQDNSAIELMTDINSETCSSAIGTILDLMHQRKAKTFESLYACYLKDSLKCIQKKLPQLNLAQCMEVKEKAKIFYSRQILINYFEALKETVAGFFELTNDSKPVSVDDLNIFCHELSKIKDFNSRMKDPVIMNFEFRSKKYRLKPEQVKDVELLTTKDQNNMFPSFVIQRMMAAGKTLVIGTISVVKKALDSKQLSILVPPSSLYQSNTSAMQNRTYQCFKKKGINFNFPRFEIPTKNNEDSIAMLDSFLKNINEIITNTMAENNYLILSPESLHSFLNSYIEVLLNAENNWAQKYQLILIRYAKIYRIFKQRGSIILDEIDMTMDPKKELNFPTQEMEPYNMSAVAMITDIMEFLIFDKEVIDAGLHIHSNNQASLTTTNYKHCVQLVLKYIENQIRDSSSLWHSLIYGARSHGASLKEIMDFLSDPNMAGSKEWITRFHKTGNQIIADALIIVKHQLHHQMEHAFNGTVNQNFGSAGKLRPEIKFAVPYVAANTPSTASVFADRWETLLKTLLMVSASPCSLDIAKEFIEYARNTITSESVVSESLQSTVTYRNLKLVLLEDLCPLSLDSKKILHVQAVQQALATRSPAAIRLLFTFYITQVFDKMTFPTEQITSNALNVVSMFNSVQGYSGTIDNVSILPQHVIRDAYEDHMRNEKSNGGISLKLVKDCEGKNVQELSEASFTKSAQEMVQDLMALYPSNHVSAIIDTGAYFKNFKNVQVAKAILSVFNNIKAVLYYDEDSNQLEFLRSNGGSYSRGILETTDSDDISRSTQVEIESRFTFYDQRHITGSDILQPKAAHAIMTVGPRVLLRDILQGALRMRQFMTSQKIHLVTTKASRNFYASKIMQDVTEMGVTDVLTLGALNEEEKQKHENVKLAFGKINAEIRSFVLDEISRALLENAGHTQKFVLEMTASAGPLFLRSIKEVPLDWLQESKDENATNILTAYAASRLNPLSHIMANFMSNHELLQRFNSMKKGIKNMISPENKKYYYNKETIRTSISLDAGSEVQQQTLTLTMVDLNMDNQALEKTSPSYSSENMYSDLLEKLEYNQFDESLDLNLVYISFEILYKEKYSNEKFKPYLANALVTSGNRIGVTLNLINLAEADSKNRGYPIFSQYTFEGTHILVQVFRDNLKALLISSKHASSIVRKELGSIRSSKFWLCDLSGIVTATNDPETRIGENVLDFIPQIDNLMFDLLTFNGSLPQILANPKLKAIYDNWLRSEHFKMRAMFLRLRMKALMEKEKEIFEVDDKNLKRLQELSMGIRSSTESIVDGYPKNVIDADYETKKIELLGIASRNLNELDIPQNEPIHFNLDAEIKQLLNVPEETSSEISGPDFVAGPEDVVIVDVNLDEREVPVETLTRREIIHVKQYSMVEELKDVYEVKEKIVGENLDTEIFVDESVPEYQEPALAELEKIEMSEHDVSFKPLVETEPKESNRLKN